MESSRKGGGCHGGMDREAGVFQSSSTSSAIRRTSGARLRRCGQSACEPPGSQFRVEHLFGKPSSGNSRRTREPSAAVVPMTSEQGRGGLCQTKCSRRL